MKITQEPAKQSCPKYRYPNQPPPGTKVPRPKATVEVRPEDREAAEREASSGRDLRGLVYKAPQGHEPPPQQAQAQFVEPDPVRPPKPAQRAARGLPAKAAPAAPPSAQPTSAGRLSIPLSLVRLLKKRMKVGELRAMVQLKASNHEKNLEEAQRRLDEQRSSLEDCQALLNGLASMPEDKEVQ